MSRVGLKPVTLPSGVTADVTDHRLKVTGPKGSVELIIPKGITLTQSDQVLQVARAKEHKQHKALHGLTRALVQNAVTGVSEGFSAKIEIHGVGYRFNLAGQQLKLALGFSHEVSITIPEGVAANLDQNVLTLSGIDKQQVEQAAAAIRGLKPPEPYKGKGLRFSDEYIIRKSGKAAATGKE